MGKKEFSSFQEELEYDYHRMKEWNRKKQKVKFIGALPIIFMAVIVIIAFIALALFGIIGRFIFL